MPCFSFSVSGLQADPRVPKGKMEAPKVERSNRATSEDLRHKLKGKLRDIVDENRQEI